MILTRSGAAATQMVLCAAWLGAGILLAAVVAPAAFAVLPTRELAGDVVGRVLPVLFYWGMGVYVIVSLLGARTDRESRWKPRLMASAVGGVACAMAQFIVGSSIARLRASVGGSIDVLAPTDPRRVAFGQLHAESVLLLGVAMMAALTVVAVSVRDSRAGG